MPEDETFHSSRGSCDFLGLRHTRSGGMEIVYDDGAARRIIWKVTTPGAGLAAPIAEAMRLAVDQLRVVPVLHSELKRREISIEAVAV